MRATYLRHVNARPINIPASLVLKVTSDPANLASIRKQIEAFAAAVGFDDKATAEIGLCVNEAVANVIRHAYAGKTDRPIHLDVSACSIGSGDEADRELTIGIRDWGNGVDPSRLPQRPYDPLEPGGVGLICLAQWMNKVIFTPQPDGMLATLKRVLPKGPAKASKLAG